MSTPNEKYRPVNSRMHSFTTFLSNSLREAVISASSKLTGIASDVESAASSSAGVGVSGGVSLTEAGEAAVGAKGLLFQNGRASDLLSARFWSNLGGTPSSASGASSMSVSRPTSSSVSTPSPPSTVFRESDAWCFCEVAVADCLIAYLERAARAERGSSGIDRREVVE